MEIPSSVTRFGKTELEVRAISSASNNLISANFSIVYIKNTLA
jgi:hypothetical protein